MTQPGEDLHELDVPLDEVVRDLEAPDADALEQVWPADPQRISEQPQVPLEASEGDAIDQARVVDLDDEDSYR
jgi:hypothetical protein